MGVAQELHEPGEDSGVFVAPSRTFKDTNQTGDGTTSAFIWNISMATGERITRAVLAAQDTSDNWMYVEGDGSGAMVPPP